MVRAERADRVPGEIWDVQDLTEFAEGKISTIFGPEYSVIDKYRRRTRLPTTEYLLVTRVTELDAEMGKFEPCSMTTEYDIPYNAWYAVDAGPCLVFEVVSESTSDVKAKDETKNPPLFEKMKVEDLVLVYPWRPASDRRLRLDVKRLDATGRYRANRPGPGGWILLASIGLRIKVAEDGSAYAAHQCLINRLHA